MIFQFSQDERGAWSGHDVLMALLDRRPHDALNQPRDAISVVLLEHHDLMRRSLRGLLDSEDGIDVVCETPDLACAQRAVRAQKPQVLIIDPHAETGLALSTVSELHRGEPNTPIVVIAMEASHFFAAGAFTAGAIGYVLKDHADTDLADAVRSAARGQQYVSPTI